MTVPPAALLAGAAPAQAPDAYTGSASVSPLAAGSRQAPRPVSASFRLTVGKPGARPAKTIARVAATFDGLRANKRRFPACTTQTINFRGERRCPRGSRIGTGHVDFVIGARQDRTATCRVPVRVYNGPLHFAPIVYAPGRTIRGRSRNCELLSSNAISGDVQRLSTGLQLSFPFPIRYPARGLDAELTQFRLTIRRRVAGGRGFVESVGRCRAGRRAARITVVHEDRRLAIVQARPRCRP